MRRIWSRMPRIYIDADGCPVVYLTLEIAHEYGIACYVVCDDAHVFSMEEAEIVIVDQGKDHVDYEILRRLHPDDIVVTQDYGLAAMALSKNARPISQNGVLYTSDNMDGLLAQRHFYAKQRKISHRFGSVKKRSTADDRAFIQALRKLLDTV